MKQAICVLLGTVLVALWLPAMAQFGGLGKVAPTCSNDHGVKEMAVQMNQWIYDAYGHSAMASVHTLKALGFTEDAEKILGQLKDSKETKAEDAAKVLENSDSNAASLNDKCKKASGKKLSDSGKKLIKEGSIEIVKASAWLTAAGAIAIPIGINAKKAIDGNKVCATSLTPIINTAIAVAKTAERLVEFDKNIKEIKKTNQLKPLTDEERKKIYKDTLSDDAKEAATGQLGLQ